MRDAGLFESAEVFGHYYGTSLNQLESRWQRAQTSSGNRLARCATGSATPAGQCLAFHTAPVH